jgi:cell division septal protein FtsQ
MKLKPQPRAPKRTSRGTRAAPRRNGARPRGRQARRPGVPLRQRMSGRLPSIRRVLAAVAAVAAVAGLVVLLNGPWLRVTQVAWAGQHFTAGSDLERLLAPQKGRSVLAVDTRTLRERLERLPSVASASVSASLAGRVSATVVEREVAFVWETSSARFLSADDGTIFAAVHPDDPLAAEIAIAPRVIDERFVARLITVGDEIPDALLDATKRILAIDPAALGSVTPVVEVRLDDEFGFRLVSAEPAWEVALGVYGTNPRETSAAANARLERQVTAVRTLFATRPESGIGWVDVRNPGKVYFRAKG